MTVLDELLALEHRGWASLCDGTGADVYGALMAADGVMVLAGGLVLDRPGVVASLHNAPPWRGYEISDERLVGAGVGAASLVYTGQAWRDGDSTVFMARMSALYVRYGGEWRLACYQQTPVQGGG